MRFVFGILLAAGAMNADANAMSLQSWTTEVAVLAATIDEPNTPAPAPNKVPRAECKLCNGTGRVKTGDGISWTVCENCTPDAKQTPACCCGEDCRCENCQCGFADSAAVPTAAAIGDAYAMLDRAAARSREAAHENETCDVNDPACKKKGGGCDAGAGGNCAGNGASDGLVAGQPLRNAGRLLRGAAGVVRNQLARGIERRQERRANRRARRGCARCG